MCYYLQYVCGPLLCFVFYSLCVQVGFIRSTPPSFSIGQHPLLRAPPTAAPRGRAQSLPPALLLPAAPHVGGVEPLAPITAPSLRSPLPGTRTAKTTFEIVILLKAFWSAHHCNRGAQEVMMILTISSVLYFNRTIV